MVVDNNVINDSLQQTTLFPPSFRQTMPGNGYVTPNATTSQHGGFNQPGPSFSCSPVSPYQLNPNLFDPQCDNPMLPGPSMPLRDQQWTNYPLPMSNQVPAMLPGPQPPLNQWYLPHPNLSDPRCANPMLPGPSMPLRDQQWTNYQLPMRNQVPAMLPGPQPPLNQWHQYSNIHQPQPGHAYMTPNATTSEHGGFIQPGPSFPAPRSQYFSNQGHVDPAAVIPNIDNVQQENFVPGSQMDNLQVRGLQNQTAMPNASKPGLDTSLQSQNRGLNTQQVEMGGSNDSFRNYVEERADGSMKCKFCPHTYATRTSISRIKWHLSREEGHGVSICRGVAKEVQEAAWKAMCGGNKRHKITASSINVNDCGISRMVQSKDEEIDSSSRKRRKADLTAMTEPESSRSRPEGAYDVFLSFRGEDTRKTFTDHLYAALDQAGILTFRDDELPIGEDISHYILRAIQESKISIVIFSYGYASSRWCLNELVEILKCKRKKTGQIVLPIFYDIDPSDVRKQNGSFAEAFVKHEERFEEKLVKEWRKALEYAGNLSGWNLNDMANGHEAKFIKEIIKDVLNKLDPKYLYVGMDRLARNIFDFLSTATDDVRIAGIHGMPGIGKTTIAAAMTEPESSRFRPEGAYDVFLSFRGEDTRKTFIDHLYAALDQAGICTFRDDDIRLTGEEIYDHLLRAIQESKICIVVFSKGYASSRWCLNELVEILKCKNRKTGQIVLPIFYDIDSSYVRKQNGSFAEAFVKHEERFEEKLVKEWRKALEDAGNLSGWSRNDMANGHEAKFIKEIIKDVMNKLEPKYLDVPEQLVGMDGLARNIFDLLNTATDDVRIVGMKQNLSKILSRMCGIN